MKAIKLESLSHLPSHFLLGMSLFCSFTQAQAQVQTQDIHPYQSQFMLRTQDGTIESVPAMTANYDKNLFRMQPLKPDSKEKPAYPDAMTVYDVENPLPEIQVMGGNYAYFKGGYITTISADGLFSFLSYIQYEPDTLGAVAFASKRPPRADSPSAGCGLELSAFKATRLSSGTAWSVELLDSINITVSFRGVYQRALRGQTRSRGQKCQQPNGI